MSRACIIFVIGLENQTYFLGCCFFFRKYEYNMFGFFPIPMQLYLVYIYVEFISSNVCFNIFFKCVSAK